MKPLNRDSKHDIETLRGKARKKLRAYRQAASKQVRDGAALIDRIALLSNAGDPERFSFYGSNRFFRSLLSEQDFVALAKLFLAYSCPYDENGRTAILLINQSSGDEAGTTQTTVLPVNMKAIEKPGSCELIPNEFPEAFCKIVKAEAKQRARERHTDAD